MPPDHSDPGRSFLRLKESLGSLLLCWSRLEDALGDAVRRLDGAAASSKASFVGRLAVLRSFMADTAPDTLRSPARRDDLATRIDGVRRTRNLIAHRLSGICADPAKGEPHIVCDSGAGARRTPVRITQAELTDLLAEIDRCTRDLAQIT